MILSGELDHLPEQAFYLGGNINEVKEKAKKIESESKSQIYLLNHFWLKEPLKLTQSTNTDYLKWP